MNVTGYQWFQSSYSYGSNGRTSALPGYQNPNGQSVADKLATGSNWEEDSVQYKLAQEASFEKALEEAKETDPAEHARLLARRDNGVKKSLDQLIREGDAAADHVVTYNGVAMAIDSENQKISVGDTVNERSINVSLSNGYTLSFTRDSIDSISQMLDLFTPEDINKIMEAITIDNMTTSVEEENEQLKDKAAQGKTGAADASESSEESETVETKNMDFRPVEDEEGQDSEDSKTKSEIVVNADGSRQLVITTKVGNAEMVTKIELSPAKDEGSLNHGDENAQAETDPFKAAADEEIRSWTSDGQLASQQYVNHAISSYEANFAYA